MTFERKALTSFLLALCLLPLDGLSAAAESPKAEPAEKATGNPPKGKEEAPAKDREAKPDAEKKAPSVKTAEGDKAEPPPEKQNPAKEGEMPAAEEDDEATAERKEAEAGTSVARPVSSDPVQVYGWREWVLIGNLELKMPAKLDTGALTSSIHAEEKELFERDGKSGCVSSSRTRARKTPRGPGSKPRSSASPTSRSPAANPWPARWSA